MVTVVSGSMKTTSPDARVMGGPAPPQVAASSQSPSLAAMNAAASAS